jgi:VCBS repeat-containing protein
VVGVISGGSDGADLIVALTPEATEARLSAIVSALTWTNIGDNPGSDPEAIDSRVLTLTVNDGSNDSVPATRHITVDPINDPPVITAHTIVLTPGISVKGVFTATDPEGGTVVFSNAGTIVPNKGSITIASDGSYTYTHTNLTAFADSVLVQADDGTVGGVATSSVPVIISNVDPLAPVITSPAPMRTITGTTFSYTPSVTAALGVVLEYQLVPPADQTPLILGDADPWAFSSGLSTSPTSADGTFKWDNIQPPVDGTGYYRFGILVIDRTNNRATYQPILLKVTAAGAG